MKDLQAAVADVYCWQSPFIQVGRHMLQLQSVHSQDPHRLKDARTSVPLHRLSGMPLYCCPDLARPRAARYRHLPRPGPRNLHQSSKQSKHITSCCAEAQTAHCHFAKGWAYLQQTFNGSCYVAGADLRRIGCPVGL